MKLICGHLARWLRRFRRSLEPPRRRRRIVWEALLTLAAVDFLPPPFVYSMPLLTNGWFTSTAPQLDQEVAYTHKLQARIPRQLRHERPRS